MASWLETKDRTSERLGRVVLKTGLRTVSRKLSKEAVPSGNSEENDAAPIITV